jgi:hypothetical protein
LTTKASRPEDFPIFGSLGVEATSRMFTILHKHLGNLSKMLQVDTTKIIISQSAIMEAIERVEKRRVYFHVFYDGCKMGELNETVLLCYWILKLHPFSFPGMDADVINAKIALCLFTDTVVGYVQDTYGKKALISSQFLKDVYYSFRFRELSKEAIMLLFGSLGLA